MAFQRTAAALTIVSIWLCAGCRTHPSKTDRDPYQRHFIAYVGEHREWPISSDAFAQAVEGITIYYGWPPSPYELIGLLTVDELNLARLAQSAKAHNANAVLIVDAKDVQVGTKVDHGFTWFGNNWAWTQPDHISADIRKRTTAALVFINTGTDVSCGPLRAQKPPTKLADIEYWIAWCDQHPQGGSVADGKGGQVIVQAEDVGPLKKDFEQQRLQIRLREAYETIKR